MHGRLRAAWCTTCDQRHEWTGTLVDRPPCPTCGQPTLRPDVVWFGEVPYDMDAVQRALFDCDLFVAIGTSGLVYPAAAFVHYAIGAGADTLELNLAPDRGQRLRAGAPGTGDRDRPGVGGGDAAMNLSRPVLARRRCLH